MSRESLDRLEALANDVLDIHATFGPFNAAKRRSYEPQLEEYEDAQESAAFRGLDQAAKERHRRTIEALREIVAPPPPEELPAVEFPLEQLELMTLSVLDLCKSYRRPLLPREREQYHFIVVAWHGKNIDKAMRGMNENQLDYYADLFARLFKEVCPDPPEGEGRIIPLTKRRREAVRAERNEGNGSYRNLLFAGMDVRTVLTAQEIEDRAAFAARLSQGTMTLLRELALSAPTLHDDLAPLLRLGNQVETARSKFMSKFKGAVNGHKKTLASSKAASQPQRAAKSRAMHEILTERA